MRAVILLRLRYAQRDVKEFRINKVRVLVLEQQGGAEEGQERVKGDSRIAAARWFHYIGNATAR
jgi:hypothetical protein